MSNKQARALRKKAAANGEGKDLRRAIRLDLRRAAGGRILGYLQGTIRQVLNSGEVGNIVATYVDAKDLQGPWGVEVKGMKFGEIWLVPRAEEHNDPTDGPSAGRARKEAAAAKKNGA